MVVGEEQRVLEGDSREGVGGYVAVLEIRIALYLSREIWLQQFFSFDLSIQYIFHHYGLISKNRQSIFSSSPSFFPVCTAPEGTYISLHLGNTLLYNLMQTVSI